ncbi:MAG: SRPBCC domain-containing protein [Holophaga sp.]|nr:SRPBCC domain-containing protein [Holophaga sp.]
MSRFHTTRELPASPEAVFAAIWQPERLARWWGPEGFTNTFHTFEFRPGGAWVFTMHGPDGTDYPNQSEFLEIVTNALVRIKHVNLPHFELSISLEATSTGTRVTWVGDFENRDFAEQARSFLETANEQNLDRLTVEVCGRGAFSES